MMYTVRWEIEVDANDETEAARVAAMVQGDQTSGESLPGTFDVQAEGEAEWTTVDLTVCE